MAWTKEEKDCLINLCKVTTFKEISITLNKKESTVRVMAKRLGLNKKEHVEANQKKCSKCGFVYPASTDYFPKDVSKKDGLHNYCKDCHREYRYKKKAGFKKCNKCELIKCKLEFQVRKNNKDGYDNYCKECRSYMQKKYYREKEHNYVSKSKLNHIKKYGW